MVIYKIYQCDFKGCDQTIKVSHKYTTKLVDEYWEYKCAGEYQVCPEHRHEDCDTIHRQNNPWEYEENAK